MNEDGKILRLLLLRDEQAVALAEQRYGRLCRSVAYRILGDKQDAEECVNDVMLKLWHSVPPAKPRSLTAYLSGMTRNLALDRLSAKHTKKRGGVQQPVSLDELSAVLAAPDTPEDSLETAALRDALEQFLRALPKDACMVFLARYYAMLPVREIAKQHGSTAGQVQMSLKRTKEKLRIYLNKEGFL
jgi:RNA polymerase sigma-70 factor (ECF subfamily)